MKFTPFIAAAILAYGATADEAQKPLTGDESAADSATSSVDASLPTFTVSPAQPIFFMRATATTATQTRSFFQSCNCLPILPRSSKKEESIE